MNEDHNRSRSEGAVPGMNQDTSYPMKKMQLLQRQIEAYTEEQAMLLGLSSALASSLEFQPGLILDHLREIVEFSRGGLFALEESTLVSLAMRDMQGEADLPVRIQLQSAEVQAALFNGHRPICIADLGGEDPQAQLLLTLLAEAAVLTEGMQSLIWIPLAVRGHIIGGIILADPRKDFFTNHHADLALIVANQATITMINAEVYKHTQALAVLEERQRLARDLHDAVNQSLFSAGLIAEVLPRLWDQDQSEARRSLEDLRRLVRGAQAEMRALLAELRPSTLTDSNLDELLRLLGNAHTGRTNTPVTVSVTGEFTLPAEVQVAFYRVCQEALLNIAKHAKASRVEIALKQGDAEVELRVWDDGQGFDPDQSFSGHYGLRMMRERAEAVGAGLSISSQPGHGTELTICWTKPPAKEAV